MICFDNKNLSRHYNTFTVHLESNELRLKENLAFNEQSKIPVFFSFFDSLKYRASKELISDSLRVQGTTSTGKSTIECFSTQKLCSWNSIKDPLSAVKEKKYLRCWAPRVRLNHAIAILGVGESRSKYWHSGRR